MRKYKGTGNILLDGERHPRAIFAKGHKYYNYLGQLSLWAR